MSTEPRTEDADDMPAEVDFSRGVRGLHYRPQDGDDIVLVRHADGTVEERRMPAITTPDQAAFAPDSITGVVGDVLFYVYNPATDVISLRLVSSLAESVAFGEEQEGFYTVTSEASGKPVGLVVRDFTRRFLGASPAGQPLNSQRVEQGLRLLREGMRLAA